MAKEQTNRQEQSEISSLKGEVAARHRGAGAGMNVLARVEKAHPNDPKKQLAAFLRDFVIKSGTGRVRPVSAVTSTRYTENLMLMIDELRAERAAIRNLGEFGKTHAVKLIGAWVRDGLSAGTIQNKISYMRRFLTFVGKENLVPRGAQLKEWMTANGIQPRSRAPSWPGPPRPGTKTMWTCSRSSSRSRPNAPSQPSSWKCKLLSGCA